VRESLGNNQHRSNADPGSTIKKADAEALTGIDGLNLKTQIAVFKKPTPKP